ncbi:MAG: hypothetical protein ACR2K6_03065 [Solirubrobacterales bacterium]
METKQLIHVLGVGRLAIGAVLVAKPDAVTAGWVGRDGSTPGGRILARGLGIRDAVVGAATLATANDPAKRAPVLAAGVICDLIDATATGTTDELPASKRIPTIAIAGGAALVGIWAAAS